VGLFHPYQCQFHQTHLATATIQGQGTESFVYVPNSYGLTSGTVVRNEIWRKYPGGYSAHDPIVVNEQTISTGVKIPVNWNSYTGNYSIYHTPGTCQAANTCANPVTLQVYSSDYPFQ
jgi:hypothetical protein